MNPSKLILKIVGGKLQIGYKIERVSLSIGQGIPASITDAKSSAHSRYDMTFALSKKIRKSLLESIQKKIVKKVFTFGNITIGLLDQTLTVVVKTDISLKKLRKQEDTYLLDLQEAPGFHLRISFDDVFYATLKKTMQVTSTEKVVQSKPTNEKKPAEPTNKSSASNKHTKKPKAKKRVNGGSSIWAPDGSLKKKETTHPPQRLPYISHSSSSHRNCANCQNLNSGNVCAIHRVKVDDSDVCSRFYRFTILLGGGVNPR